ncbi:type 11 methyltransferase [Candidatus Methylomirabilis lanthanidiphila]|uniref:Type 11 methyltransferase n=1 Tax=Candidatus Methylomirabilis lanthanidiphila TaxID=2211376 RepID=A0A564ZL78_9BACT|nr:class I SAM-dependent methyltransferase [Candidatus Methylomirabilis lanthanidiphila]VUZ85412.1 type 11 methyltransferase [Candidatus Methylomirabilis lanthanidiphila]
MAHKKTGYVPALGWNILTPLYDPLVRLTTREMSFKSRLLDEAGIDETARILDVGCGTGTLLLLTRRRSKSLLAIGLDGDMNVLGIARSKAHRRAEKITLIQAFCFNIPFADGAFDRVLSSLMLHHLTRSEKVRTLQEVVRVLRPGGELHVADWGQPHNLLMRVLAFSVRLGDSFARTADNIEGRLPALFRDAGLENISETARFATLFGTLSLYRARKPLTAAASLS